MPKTYLGNSIVDGPWELMPQLLLPGPELLIVPGQSLRDHTTTRIDI